MHNHDDLRFFALSCPFWCLFPKGEYLKEATTRRQVDDPVAENWCKIKQRPPPLLASILHRSEDAGLNTRTRLRLDSSCPSFAQQSQQPHSITASEQQQPPFCCCLLVGRPLVRRRPRLQKSAFFSVIRFYRNNITCRRCCFCCLSPLSLFAGQKKRWS